MYMLIRLWLTQNLGQIKLVTNALAGWLKNNVVSSTKAIFGLQLIDMRLSMGNCAKFHLSINFAY